MSVTPDGNSAVRRLPMMAVYNVLIVLSSVLFLWYGLTTLLRDGMHDDFTRFGLSQYRRLTGALEALGALGLLVGLILPPLVIVSAGGLSLMMLLGFIARVRVRDSWMQTLPSVVLMLLNAFLAAYAISTFRSGYGPLSISLW